MLIRFLIFLLIFFTLIGLSQWWAYKNLTELFGHRRFFFWSIVVVIAFTISYIIVGQLRLSVPQWLIDFVYRPMNVYIAVSLFLTILFPVWWLIGKTSTIGAHDELTMQSRRDFIEKAAKVGLVGVYSLSLGDALFSAQRDRIKKYTVKLPNLPKELEGVRIAQLSDIHVGVYWGIERFESLAEKLKRISPDFLVITGDIVDNSPAYASVVTEGFKLLTAKKDCIAILGNHDHYANAEVVAQAVRQTHFKLLRNESHIAEHNGAKLCFLGIEDPMGSIEQNDATNESGLREALKSHEGFPIALMHRPTQWEAVKKFDLPFALCGHTHAGQVAIPGTQINFGNIVYKHSVGFYDEVTSNGLMSKLFVHPGNGVAGVPIRIGCPPEIAVFELRSA